MTSSVILTDPPLYVADNPLDWTPRLLGSARVDGLSVEDDGHSAILRNVLKNIPVAWDLGNFGIQSPSDGPSRLTDTPVKTRNSRVFL